MKYKFQASQQSITESKVTVLQIADRNALPAAQSCTRRAAQEVSKSLPP